ncbi:xylan alpha-(1-_2)-glucuronosidase [Spirochaetia bacterium]|nr:xylan alpha-(1->2)-glucuronosidase [Spirochaetia bacterium]
MAYKEYDCWFQSTAKDTVLKDSLNNIYAEDGNEILKNAASELARGLDRLFGIKASVTNSIPAAPSESGVIVGTIPFVDKANDGYIGAQKSEGFVIKVSGKRIYIAGQDAQGTLYGVYRFLALLSLGKITGDCEIADAPAAAYRIINHWDNMDGSIERGYAGKSVFFKDNRVDYDPQRIEDYARLLASIGINKISINNVNIRGEAHNLITEEALPKVKALADIFRPFGIKLLFSISFGAPYSLGKIGTADPLDPAVAAWWKERAGIIYRYIPDLAGFLVKADSESTPGPFQYGRTHVDGANMLAAALKPFGGEVVWRCFVYNSSQDWRDLKTDRPRAAYDHFIGLDGKFADNVILQIKNGPLDFQVREPVAPLFGALTKTRHIMEFQVTQEYTGHQIDLCYLPYMWADVLNFDTAHGPGTKIKEMIGGRIEGFAGVGNVGLDENWTGHTLAQANWYGYGRLTWNPGLSAETVAEDWTNLTFGANGSEAVKTVYDLLLKSYPVYEKYNAPYGAGFMVNPGFHYGPSPEGYEYSRWGTYLRAADDAFGIDRTPSGTGFTTQFAPANAAIFADPKTCPENVILFFHRLRYDYVMRNGETLLQNIYDNHFSGCEDVEAMAATWKALKGKIDDSVYQSVLERFDRQITNAREWRDVINTYFWRKTRIADKRGRKIYE